MKEWNTIIVYRTNLSIVIIIVLIVLVDLIAYSIQHTGYNQCQGTLEEADAINNNATSNLKVAGIRGGYSTRSSIRSNICKKPQTIFSDIWSE